MNNANATYVTYFDSGYLTRALTLIKSIRANGDNSQIWVLCLDSETFEYLNRVKIAGLHAITLGELEAYEPRLLDVKSSRSRVEYIFTVGPTFHQCIMLTQADKSELVVYLDADLYFFADPSIVVREMGSYSVGIIEHRYKKRLRSKLDRYGRFNVGWVGFRNDELGRKVLHWWAERCLDWCFDTPQSDGRYADQGYLNWFPDFEGVKILNSAGFNLAPWNTGSHHLTYDSTNVQADGLPLVFFHFHGIQETKNYYITSQLIYKNFATKELLNSVYKPYLEELLATEQLINEASHSTHRPALKRGKGMRGKAFNLYKQVLNLASTLSGNAIRKKELVNHFESRS